MSYNKLKALEGNIEAISTALAIHEKRRNATTAERETLSKFTGCGGIKEVLSIGTGTPIPDTMQEAVKRLLSVLSKAAKGNETLYRQLLQSLKSSVLTAFYTPTFLIQAVAKQIKDTFTANDLKMGTFLEPVSAVSYQSEIWLHIGRLLRKTCLPDLYCPPCIPTHRYSSKDLKRLTAKRRNTTALT